VLKLEEELRITDENGDFYFKIPWEIKVALDGFIFTLFTVDEEGGISSTSYSFPTKQAMTVFSSGLFPE